ncbi:hypothetical protein LUZ60_004731 [Juncus effusus]|nr:hypothetical protein LUZ60_004731 [Juncus effusus]
MVAQFRRSFKRTPIRRFRRQNQRRLSPPSISSSSNSSSASHSATPSNNSPVSISSYPSETIPVSSPSDYSSFPSRPVSPPASVSPSRSVTLSKPSFLASDLGTEYNYIPVAALPIFKGDSNECPFVHISRFDHACLANNVISPSMAAGIFPASLDSVAALWYDSFIDPSKPWEEVRAEFLSSFRLPISKCWSQLSSFRQSNDETVNHYYIRLHFILNRWPEHNLSDETLNSIFIDGLKKELKDRVLPQGPITLYEAYRLAKSRELEEEIREAHETALKRVIKCEFCGLEGHEESACEVRKKMRMLWAKSSFKGSFVKREGKEEGIKGGIGKSGSLNRQCSCPKHQCWKKIERTESVKSEREEFYDAAEE